MEKLNDTLSDPNFNYYQKYKDMFDQYKIEDDELSMNIYNFYLEKLYKHISLKFMQKSMLNSGDFTTMMLSTATIELPGRDEQMVSFKLVDDDFDSQIIGFEFMLSDIPRIAKEFNIKTVNDKYFSQECVETKEVKKYMCTTHLVGFNIEDLKDVYSFFEDKKVVEDIIKYKLKNYRFILNVNSYIKNCDFQPGLKRLIIEINGV